MYALKALSEASISIIILNRRLNYFKTGSSLNYFLSPWNTASVSLSQTYS